ncbi:MAG: cob(I)yrinic acid a,c-diamide adenosyltransferase [Chloroflexi bacterium]|nr:cob(I)yrinic acid a,c-diamide adenosyltransferase [Chloroflexota bacterium]
MSPLDRGQIQIYTGSGKGKTTAALGLALRALGRGLSVYMIQFLKGDTEYGELKALEKFSDMTVEQFGRADFVNLESPDPIDIKLAGEALARAGEIIGSGKYDIVILDEACVAVGWGLIKIEDLEELLKNKPPVVELILTGRSCPWEIIKKADLVTEMKEIRHYYKKGVPARIGIEY